MTGYQRNSFTVFLVNEGRILVKCIGNKLISPSWFASGGGFDNDNLAYIRHKMFCEYGVTVDDLEEPKLRYVTLRYTEGELRQNFFFFAETKNDLNIPFIGNDKWVPFMELLEMEMPKTVQGVLKHYLEIGRSNERVYCGVVKQKGLAISELEEF